MRQRTCVVYIPTCSLTTGTYFVWVNRYTLLIVYSCVPSQCEYTLATCTHVLKVSLMMVYCSAPSVKYYYDVAMVHTDGHPKQAVLLLTGMV